MNKKDIAIWTLFGLTAIVSLYLIMVLGFWFLDIPMAYPGTSVAGMSVSGKSKDEIKKVVTEKVDKNQPKEVIFISTGEPVTVKTADLELVADPDATAESVLSWSQKYPFVLGQSHEFPIIYRANSEALFAALLKISNENSSTAVDTTLYLEGDHIKAKTGSAGKRINLTETAANFYETVGKLQNRVEVSEFYINPSFSEAEVLAQNDQIKKATSESVILSASEQDFEVDPSTLVSWVALSGTQPVYARLFGDDVLFAPLTGSNQSDTLFSEQKISDYLTNLSGKINQEPKNARLAAVGGKVVVTTPSVSGKYLEVSESTESVLKAVNTDQNEAALSVAIVKSEVREDNLETLGISELVSTGFTNFAGSPANRIHNVRTGASKFNGVLIKPGEDFSFNTTLGPVDASTGYLPELVILEDKTTKEFGGGMCQVSSTAFRAALNAGMPILERLYHAYPVSYYKPYGVDATIYLPKPDLVFENDTGHYILIQTHIDGYKLTFDFYGTKPNRTVSFAGSGEGVGAVPIVEQITPLIYDQGARGKGSFTAQFWRFIYDESGKMIKKSNWVSKYDSPDKYPH